MGKRGGRRGGGGGGGGGTRRRAYQRSVEIVRENDKLQKYYDTLLEFPDEDKERFWEALRRDLPTSFRFCGSKEHAKKLQKLLQDRYIPQINNVTFEDQLVQPPQPVPWYELAWSMTTSKNVIRRFPPFAAFQRFLVSETTVGNISRSELVSMIPPLLMDVRPGMTVLDMCAAPGSKAGQLLEMIHQGEESRIRNVIKAIANRVDAEHDAEHDAEDNKKAELPTESSDDGRATGLLIANDVDYKRSHMLTHQLKRLSSPNLMVTNHDATMYPAIRVPSPAGDSKPRYLKLDRILADVPCSGDGTLRKNIAIWKNWNASNALGLHPTQVRILVRALSLLKAGGRVAYSTCSMNPVENEAVVAAALDRCGGLEKVELVDCSEALPGLKRAPGMKTWKVMDKSHRIWNNWKEVIGAKDAEGSTPGLLSETMFSGGEASKYPLERCMRVYPHMQDTGAFFIAVLHKKAEFKTKPEDAKTTRTQAQTNGIKRPVNDEEERAAKRQKSNEPADQDEAVVETITGTDTRQETAELDGVMTEDAVISEGNALETVLGVEKTGTETETETGAAQTESPEPRMVATWRRGGVPYEESFKFLKPTNEVIKTVTNFYGISPRFPTDRYLVRNATGRPAKSIYYTSELVRDILVLNEGRGVKFVHAGVKMFVKQDSPSAEVCQWRIQTEGIGLLHGYVGPDRVVVLRKKETLRRMLIEMFPKMVDDDGVPRLGEVGEQVQGLGMGCCVLRVEPDTDELPFCEEMVIPLWKSFQSLNLMLPKEDRAAMLLRIFNDTTPLVNMGLNRDKKANKTAEAAGDEAGEEAVGEAGDIAGDEAGDKALGEAVTGSGADEAQQEVEKVVEDGTVKEEEDCGPR